MSMGLLERLDLLIDRGVPRKLAREVASVGRGGSTPERTELFESAVGWSVLEPGATRREVLVMAGERGRGKSFAAAVIMIQQRVGTFARWANARHISDWLHQAKFDPLAKRSLDRVRMGQLLVIDDLGWEHLDGQGYVLGSLVGLLDDRIQAELRTIVTTNLDETNFRQRYGDALHDRVRGYGTWIDATPGASMRGK